MQMVRLHGPAISDSAGIRSLAGEQVCFRFGVRRAPVIAEFGEQLRAEHNIAVLPAFALTDVNEHARAVDVPLSSFKFLRFSLRSADKHL